MLDFAKAIEKQKDIMKYELSGGNTCPLATVTL
ncbi:TIGR00266 family protein, partial [Lactobacillus delbrueckii subsp. bulgaricus]|nr:TIGR00266 family protein [Lactobacillus delbrueckii subsp. bulgaricus]